MCACVRMNMNMCIYVCVFMCVRMTITAIIQPCVSDLAWPPADRERGQPGDAVGPRGGAAGDPGDRVARGAAGRDQLPSAGARRP